MAYIDQRWQLIVGVMADFIQARRTNSKQFNFFLQQKLINEHVLRL